eukprot:TRINITY_DN244_c0_g1_i3.p2 TRINITY_DN244_c0_g1~~TRINITY_DN244_c0_g1_i3.p2  ORF type:complete len:206 (-),score=75.96 TRINITY_DN244_c0_g1_i3:165-782(-)
MSFIEGHLSICPPGASSWQKRWCKVDKAEFSWATGEGASPLGRLALGTSGTVMPTSDSHGLFRFDLHASGSVLQCSALSEAELDGWVDFLVTETGVVKSNAPPVAAAPAAAAAAASGGKKVTQRSALTMLVKEAIAEEEFEKCVKYRKFRTVLDAIDAAIAEEDFEKCVELRAEKKKLEKELPEIAEKKAELEAARRPCRPRAAR